MICSSNNMECVNNINVDTSKCLQACSGLIVTTFSKSEQKRNLEKIFSVFEDYVKYKKFTRIPAGFLGKGFFLLIC